MTQSDPPSSSFLEVFDVDVDVAVVTITSWPSSLACRGRMRATTRMAIWGARRCLSGWELKLVLAGLDSYLLAPSSLVLHEAFQICPSSAMLLLLSADDYESRGEHRTFIEFVGLGGWTGGVAAVTD